LGMASSLTLVANPGSASRKYGLYAGVDLRASLHFEWLDEKIICTLRMGESQTPVATSLPNLNAAATQVLDIFFKHQAILPAEHIGRIGLRIVAPGMYFTEHRTVNQHFVDTLQHTRSRAPLHISATLEELKALHHQFPKATIVGASDSAFHASRPDFSQYYGLPLEDAEKLDIKRFGYHGLSAESVVRQLKKIGKLTPRLVIAHLGSGASATAVYRGKSVDNTMGYSPLEGLIMATRSGSVDFAAIRALKAGLNMDDARAEEYLNNQSGLLGLGGSNDIRELLKHKQKGDKQAALALDIYFFNVQKAIGQMTAAMGGIDQLVFTGTVGERNPLVRELIASRLQYLDLWLNAKLNRAAKQPTQPTIVSEHARSKPVFVVPANEAGVIAAHTKDQS